MLRRRRRKKRRRKRKKKRRRRRRREKEEGEEDGSSSEDGEDESQSWDEDLLHNKHHVYVYPARLWWTDNTREADSDRRTHAIPQNCTLTNPSFPPAVCRPTVHTIRASL
jgi:hypothetical protein